MRSVFNKVFLLTHLCLIFLLYPVYALSQTNQIIVGSAPGGPTDSVFRKIAQELTASGVNTTINNVGGNFGITGIQTFLQTQANGTTYASFSATTLNAMKLNDLTVLLNSIEPITLIGIQSFVIITGSKSQFKSLNDLTVAAQNKLLSAGTSGDGSLSDLCIKQLINATKINVQVVPYKGTAPVLMDVDAGYVDFACVPLSSVVKVDGSITMKNLIPIAITFNEPVATLPKVPTLESLGIKGVIRGEWLALIKIKGSPINNSNSILRVLQGISNKTDYQIYLRNLQFEPNAPEDMNSIVAQSYFDRQLKK
jgi:tripartite-type tricarboxylate transporter receptor subunit TctC